MRRLLLVIACLTVVSPAAAGPIVLNGSFEQGFAGWTVNNPVWPSSEESCCPGQIRPVGFTEIHSLFQRSPGVGDVLLEPEDGRFFAEVSTGANVVAPGFPGPITVTVSQTVALTAGDRLSGWSSFYSGDNALEDFAWVRIVDANGVVLAVPWAEHSGTPGHDEGAAPFNVSTPWTQWSWQSPESGLYTLVLGEISVGDNVLLSQAFHDDIRATPEPGTLALLIVGLGSLVTVRRQKTGRRLAVGTSFT